MVILADDFLVIGHRVWNASFHREQYAGGTKQTQTEYSMNSGDSHVRLMEIEAYSAEVEDLD
jgi:hypothetical protein